jgi:hypothetical protein
LDLPDIPEARVFKVYKDVKVYKDPTALVLLDLPVARVYKVYKVFKV